MPKLIRFPSSVWKYLPQLSSIQSNAISSSPRGGDPAAEDDVDIIENGVVDLGEILAETLALELDPYPRQEDEFFSDIEEPPEPAKVSPFIALSKLKPS